MSCRYPGCTDRKEQHPVVCIRQSFTHQHPSLTCHPWDPAPVAERCAFVYTSYAPDWRDGIPCPFTREQHPLLHDWVPVVDHA